MVRRWLLVLCLLLLAGPGQASSPRPLGAQELVGGKRVDAYPALWWQWVNRKQWGAQAYQDPTGTQCGLNQSGEVWFLAGTDGTDWVRRHCRVPQGKHIFLPLITMLTFAAPGRPNTCDRVKADAANNNDHVVPVSIRLDGKPIDVSALRMKSDCFNAHVNADYLERTDNYYPAATDGYWLMLAPLKPGKHRLQVDMHYDNPGHALGDLDQRFEYDLQIGGTPEPDSLPPDQAPWDGLET